MTDQQTGPADPGAAPTPPGSVPTPRGVASWPAPHPIIDAPYGPRYQPPEIEQATDPGAAPISRWGGMRPPPGWVQGPIEPAPRSKRWLAVFVAICLVIAVGGGFLAYHFVASSGTPTKWDTKVADLAAFVEHTTGETFIHPVRIRYLADADFVKLVTQPPSALTDAQKAKNADDEAVGRAFGWFTGSSRLFDQTNQLNGAGILAFYSYSDHAVVVRTDHPDATALDVSVRVTVVHELTHALQDQRLGIRKINQQAVGSEAQDAAVALGEGHAVFVENQYIATLTPTDRDAYYQANATAGDAVGSQTKDIAAVLSIPAAAPYVYGPILVDAASHTRAGIDQLYTRPPVAMDQVLDPRAYFAQDLPESPVPPTPPEGGTKLATDTAGPVKLYLTLSTALDPLQAWDVALGWGNDSYTPYRRTDGQICVAWVVEGDTTEATGRLRGALTTWASKRESGVNAVVQPPGAEANAPVRLTLCDPGATSTQALVGDDAGRAFYLRSNILTSLLDHSGQLDASTCATDKLMHKYTLDQLTNPAADEAAVAKGFLADCA